MQWAMGTSSMIPVKGPGPSGNSNRGNTGGMVSSGGGVIYVNSRSMRRNEGALDSGGSDLLKIISTLQLFICS